MKKADFRLLSHAGLTRLDNDKSGSTLHKEYTK